VGRWKSGGRMGTSLMGGIRDLLMLRMLSGVEDLVRAVFVKELRLKSNKRELMQNDSLTFKIEMFGNLVEELNHWHQVCDNEEHEDSFEYCEQMFIDTLNAVKEMREVLLEDFDEYKQNCKANNQPTDLSYYRIEKQLKESIFSLFRE